VYADLSLLGGGHSGIPNDFTNVPPIKIAMMSCNCNKDMSGPKGISISYDPIDWRDDFPENFFKTSCFDLSVGGTPADEAMTDVLQELKDSDYIIGHDILYLGMPMIIQSAHRLIRNGKLDNPSLVPQSLDHVFDIRLIWEAFCSGLVREVGETRSGLMARALQVFKSFTSSGSSLDHLGKIFGEPIDGVNVSPNLDPIRKIWNAFIARGILEATMRKDEI
jgi:hypothetical protein